MNGKLDGGAGWGTVKGPKSASCVHSQVPKEFVRPIHDKDQGATAPLDGGMWLTSPRPARNGLHSHAALGPVPRPLHLSLAKLPANRSSRFWQILLQFILTGNFPVRFCK